MTRETGNHTNRPTNSHKGYVIGWGIAGIALLAVLIWRIFS